MKKTIFDQKHSFFERKYNFFRAKISVFRTKIYIFRKKYTFFEKNINFSDINCHFRLKTYQSDSSSTFQMHVSQSDLSKMKNDFLRSNYDVSKSHWNQGFTDQNQSVPELEFFQSRENI